MSQDDNPVNPAAAQGRAYAEAEDRRVQREAIAEGWPGAPTFAPGGMVGPPVPGFALINPSTTGARARAICEKAAELVNNDRNAVYGDAEVNFRETGQLWAVIFGHDVTPEQVAICMALVKVARLIKSPDHADSWTDGVGYLALGGGIASRPKTDWGGGIASRPKTD